MASTLPQIGLYTFKSKDLGTGLYYIPRPTISDVRTFHLNRSGTNIQDVNRMEGARITQGTGVMAAGYAEIVVTIQLTSLWLANNQNRNYLTSGAMGNYALDLAINEFYAKVVAGGLGTLVDQYSTGVSAGEPVLAQRTAYAIVNGDVIVTRIAGGTTATIECTFVIPNGKWTLSDTNLFALDGTSEMYVF